MHICILFPSNQIAVDQLSSMWLFKEIGYEVTLVTLQKDGHLHQAAHSMGIKTLSNFDIPHNNPIQYYFSLARRFKEFCLNQKVNVVIAHLQACMTIGILAQKLGGSPCIGYRHYSDNAYLAKNYKEIILDRIINPLFNKIIVPSKKVKSHMMSVEKVSSKKLVLIPYGYKFSFYPKQNENIVFDIRFKAKGADLIVCTIARLVPLKRHALLLEVISKLKQLNYFVHAFFVGNGPEESSLKERCQEFGIENLIHFEGFKTNVFDYLYASDLMVLLSNTEASNNAVKEAAYTKTPVMICNDVGDFDDYTSNEKNAFVVDKHNPQNQVEPYLKQIMDGRYNLKKMGESLWEEVNNMFDINKQKDVYSNLFKHFE